MLNVIFGWSVWLVWRSMRLLAGLAVIAIAVLVTVTASPAMMAMQASGTDLGKFFIAGVVLAFGPDKIGDEDL